MAPDAGQNLKSCGTCFYIIKPNCFFFDGSFLDPKHELINKTLYIFLLLAVPICLASVSRYFISGWEHVYGLHLVILLLAALLHFCKAPFHMKAVFLIGAYNLMAMGNLVAFNMWGLSSSGFAIGILLCWICYDMRAVFLNLAVVAYAIIYHFSLLTGTPYEISLAVTWLDVLVQLSGLVACLMPILVALNEGKLQLAEAEAKQRKQYEEIKHAEASKTTFLANTNHEIRTPLNATLGAIALLEETELTEQQQKYLRISQTSSKWLRRVIDDILDMERIEAGALEIEPSWFESTTLLEEVAIVFENIATEGGTSLKVHIQPGVPRWLYGDAGRVQQVLYNLVGNALKFTEGGRVIATLEKLGLGSTYRFTVTDTGIGIPEDTGGEVFEAFTQIDSSLGRNHQGSGLGLAICRHLVQAMGGEIDYQSKLGKGSSFWFDLDFDGRDFVESSSDEITSGVAVRSRVSLPEKTYRVLLAEDSDANRFILQAYLEIAGHQVDSASNGVEALKLAETSRYDAILMDISMPEMDGLETTRRVRASAGENTGTPIIALTAHVQKEIREQCTEAGMNDFLTKPVSRDQLLEVLDQLINSG